MNYIRGAVNAISAPYQYYKDINPATLTGAIDVIVIQRPADNGSTELACSPFHVRFGKWQVLRPSEKKVTVSVNGHPIPFDMKIGEAGEAFFIFETDDDVPDDLITSPLLRPSSPANIIAGEGLDIETTRFGAKKEDQESADVDEPEPLDLNALPSPPEEDVQIGTALNESGNARNASTERISTPIHRLSASTSGVTTSSVSVETQPNRRRASTVSVSTPHISSLPSPPPSPTRASPEKEQDERADAALKQTGHEVHVPEIRYQDGIALDAEGYHSQQPLSKKSPKLKKNSNSLHDRERSDRTIRENHVDEPSLYAFPSEFTRISELSTTHAAHTQSQPHFFDNNSNPDESHSDDSLPDDRRDYHSKYVDSQTKALVLPFPNRAISEPPPDLIFPSASSAPNSASPTLTTSKRFIGPGKLNVLSPVQEYSWEWGAFPTPSPMKSSFGKGGRLESGLGPLGSEEDHYDLSSADPRRGKFSTTRGRKFGTEFLDSKGKGILSGLSTVDSDDEAVDNIHARSRSVPPGVDESPTRDRKNPLIGIHRGPDASEDSMGRKKEYNADVASFSGSSGYGAGGKLSVSKSDSTVFKVSIEGKKVDFELSLVEYAEKERNERGDSGTEAESDDHEELFRGRQSRSTNPSFETKSRSHLRMFSPNGRWPGIDEFETARLFDKGRISFEDFIQDDQLVKDPRLVLKWTRQQFISQRDGSPLMDALVIWRDSYIRRKGKRVSIRPISPTSALSDEDQEEVNRISPLSDIEGKKLALERSRSEPPEAMKEISAGGPKSPPPTSSSWVQWWRRSRKPTNDPSFTIAGGASDQLARPELKEAFSAPSGVTAIKLLEVPTPPDELIRGSAPALPSTPVQKPSTEFEHTPTASTTSSPKKYAKTLRLTSDQLKSLNLKPGPNSITFSLSMSGVVACTARIFMWDSTDLVVISDIDGTITKSDGLGHVFAMIGRDWTHLGVAKLYTDISRNGYRILYLTSRAIGQADATRGYLKGIKQNDYQLPEGPVIMSPDRLMASLHREVIMRKPEVFKMACLRDIQRLFGEASRNPFYAGFGNRITDALSYRTVNVPSSRIFTIDSTGEVKCELLELAGYKSSYIHMTDLVDQMFPPIHRKWAPEFTDFNFWKPPLQEFALPDFSPPSPALSARSDTSTFARLRNFSLVGTRQSNIPKPTAMAAAALSSSYASDVEHPLRNTTLRQMSSLERLSSTLGFSANANGSILRDSGRSESPDSRSYSSSSYTGSEDEHEEAGWNGKRERRRSMTSMPGSLEDMNLGDEDEGEVGYVHDDPNGDYEGEYDPHGEEEIDEVAEEDAFDEDLLAAGEMKNVPFL
ncbi:nuclear elongation and deformation protein 1 [Lentinula aciculospora]|uniref:phosphatidate phosphatase n=1 Tax=Lentinula aciculospora TaxID=153920 RepID=A0A9W9ABV3_9AGAR|nr:nuclear elongation and deformation protein 1 [Lentinula aciculospora]